MNKELSSIIEEYKRFKEYLKGIDINAFEKYSREELLEFDKALKEEKDFRYLSLELNPILKKKKEEEFPDILGVHNYPILKKIEFMEESDKILLDKFLLSCGMRVSFGGYNHRWFKFIDSLSAKDVDNKILQFLIDNNMVEKKHEVYLCCDRYFYTESQILDFKKMKELKCKKEKTDEEWELYYELENKCYFEKFCSDCDEEVQFEDKLINETLAKPLSECLFTLIIDRDKKYDNI